MPNKKLKEIQAALKVVLKKIKVADGYSQTIVDANIKKNFSPKAVSRREEDDYPKIFVFPDHGENERHPSGRYRRHLRWIIVCIIKKVTDSPEADEQIMDFIDDVDQVFDSNSTIEGCVHDSEVGEWTTDGGSAHPEAVAVIELTTTYDVQR